MFRVHIIKLERLKCLGIGIYFLNVLKLVKCTSFNMTQNIKTNFLFGICTRWCSFFDSYRAKDGAEILLGINLHYLKPSLRFEAMRTLLKYRNEKRYRPSTRLKISWQVLKSLGNSKLFEHSIKAYRMDHVRSQFVQVPPRSWELVIFLPLARWQKGSKSTAWKI